MWIPEIVIQARLWIFRRDARPLTCSFQQALYLECERYCNGIGPGDELISPVRNHRISWEPARSVATNGKFARALQAENFILDCGNHGWTFEEKRVAMSRLSANRGSPSHSTFRTKNPGSFSSSRKAGRGFD